MRRKKQRTTGQTKLFRTCPDRAPAASVEAGPVLIHSRWTHLQTGEALVYLVERHQLAEFLRRYPHLDPAYLTDAQMPEPPAGYGLATDSCLTDPRVQTYWQGRRPLPPATEPEAEAPDWGGAA